MNWDESDRASPSLSVPHPEDAQCQQTLFQAQCVKPKLLQFFPVPSVLWFQHTEPLLGSSTIATTLPFISATIIYMRNVVVLP